MFRATDGTKREYTQDVVAAAVSYIKVCLGLQEHEKRSIRNAAVWIYLIQPHILNSHHKWRDALDAQKNTLISTLKTSACVYTFLKK